jgi:hypothetical protein
MRNKELALDMVLHVFVEFQQSTSEPVASIKTVGGTTAAYARKEA